MPDHIVLKPFHGRASAVCAVIVIAISVLLAAGCAPVAVPVTSQASAPTDQPILPTPTVQDVVLAAAATNIVPAATTATPTATAITAAQAAPTVESATATVTPAVADAAGTGSTPAPDKSFNAWCLPLDSSIANASDPLKPPANAKLASLTTDSLVLRNLPSNGCIFLYSFSQTAAADLQLEVSELNAPSPFYKVKLQPVTGRPDVVYAFVRHAMIIAPPVKTVTYTFALRDPLGQVLRRDQVKLYAWVPASGGSSGGGGDDKGGDSGGDDCGCTVPLP